MRENRLLKTQVIMGDIFLKNLGKKRGRGEGRKKKMRSLNREKTIKKVRKEEGKKAKEKKNVEVKDERRKE
ncbi:MAG: hypothetical protein ACTSUF_05635 [Candidatus Heimdallarchaeaceae archaeon]